MHLSRNLHYGKRKYLFGSILLMFISIICIALRMNNLTFQPDSLVNITRRLLAKDPLAGDYF